MEWIRSKGVLILLMLFVVTFSGCMEEDKDIKNTEWLLSAREDFGHLPVDVKDGYEVTLGKSSNVTALLLAGGASAIMHNSSADDRFAENMKNHQPIDGFSSEVFNTLGCPGTHFAAAGLWYALSVESEDEINKERAWTMIKALSVTGLSTVGLKAARDNETPNGKDWAWPSGHTSSSFTVAAVLDEYYGPKVGVPSYILASLVGLRMMSEGDHWASDVVFGATLGYVVGHSIAGEKKLPEVAGFTVLPYTGKVNNSSAVGVSLFRDF